MKPLILCLPAVLALMLAAGTLAAQEAHAFPGAVGFGTQTPAGRGGTVSRVTNLDAEGPGPLRAAIETAGPRTVAFEVGGAISLDQKSLSMRLSGHRDDAPRARYPRGQLD